jgi:hypothetical protein
MNAPPSALAADKSETEISNFVDQESPKRPAQIVRSALSAKTLPAELQVADTPSLHARPTQPEFPNHPLFTKRPSLFRRGLRAFVRFLLAVCVGIGGTLTWQSYGEDAKQLAVTWAAQHGWSLAWLPFREQAKPTSATAASETVPSAGPSVQTAAPAPSAPETDRQTEPSASPGSERLDALTASLATIRERVEQLAAAQDHMASDIAKLKASEQEIRQKLSTRPPPAPAAKPQPTTTPPSRLPMPLH